MIVRNVKKEDLRDVSEIAIKGWQTAYRGIVDDEYLDKLSIDEFYQKRLKDYAENGFVVAEEKNKILGFCRYREGNAYGDKFLDVDCEILALYVKPELKRKGIGKALVDYVKNEFRENKYSKMIIWCLKDNYPSRAFYEKMGGIYCGENSIQKGNKEYEEVGFIYDLKKKECEELELVFPTEEYRKQVEEYLQEFIDNGEYEIAGDGSLDKIKNFDEWLKKIKNDLYEENIEDNKIPSTLYLTVRKSDNKIVGNVQIRHKLNEKLLNYGGHIGDSVRPSERKKGYATEQIRLALKECKKLGIGNVLMDCDKTNIGSAKSIINNGGVLENEVYINGELIQRYWISLKKRYADRFVGGKVKDLFYKIEPVTSDKFNGDICYYNFKKVINKIIIPNGETILDNGYKWLEFYDYNSKIKLTAMYNEKNEIIEWYFDIARQIGKENGVPFEDDLYLDVVINKDEEIILLDEEELEEAYRRLEITKEDYDNAYKIAYDLIEKLKVKKDKLKEFTDKYLEYFLNKNNYNTVKN